jgi:predicted amidohydrolase
LKNVKSFVYPRGGPPIIPGIGMQKNEVNTLEGSASKMMAQMAKQYGMYIVSGLYNWTGDTLNNVAVLYNKKGDIQAVYKKIQLPDSEGGSRCCARKFLSSF